MEPDVGYRDQDRPHKVLETAAVPGSADRDTTAASTDTPAAENPAAVADGRLPQSTEETGAPEAVVSTVSRKPKPGGQILSQLTSAILRRPLALSYITTAVAALLFLLACRPLVYQFTTSDPKQSGLSRSLQSWSPLPQASLLLVLLALIVITASYRAAFTDKDTVPPGVSVTQEGVLCDDSTGVPLLRGLRLSKDGRKILAGPNNYPLPKCCTLGPGGVLVHKATGRAIPHTCGIGDGGVLKSSAGQSLPDSMIVGPNSTLIAVDGTVLGPDLQPLPAGFTISGCRQFLIRPNGKPVPRGVHVGPGFRLMTPLGEFLPDGVTIGPNGTIICPDGTVLGTDGWPIPRGFALSRDSSRIVDPVGDLVDEFYDMGPNGTLIDPRGQLLTALGKVLLCQHYTLGPLGNLLCGGVPVPGAAKVIFVDSQLHLVMPDGMVQLCHQCQPAV